MSDRYVDGVFLAADLAVRLTIESAARTIRNHRGRVERARYQGVADDRLHLVLDPPPTQAEVDRWAAVFRRWWGLPSVLDDHDIEHLDQVMLACHTYVCDLLLRQAVHDPAALRAYLEQVQVVSAAAD
ncbi:hypothetical protein [Gordonia sp. (in: high G+C Gram-positive bacteria)]|jgi:hypothetical protein|uniref:hypothetical protein n=1 Tax=Gordonia sp. (in: high G+C Gram-positive bacteria) TaxID=84139 RepID=UPI001DAA59B7|nr:hypothetical protein [Gordonia sp. (in: high G+C Gram-positive bacteria)]MCB1294287.1 hypothetical protein [Gordonia sp. (in: high G+C Gram-positive bacteria)]HMS77216.1 hypothetical protein [Gordonia sp. (in: high G+C Gram-positive bacteria)]